MMELGALVCLPGQPLCKSCPVAAMCAARGPVARKARAVRRRAVLRYALALREGSVLLQKRPRQSSLMPGMWELPLMETGLCDKTPPVLKLRHSITTTDYTIFVHAAESHAANGGEWHSLRSAKRLPLTGLTRKVLEKLGET